MPIIVIKIMLERLHWVYIKPNQILTQHFANVGADIFSVSHREQTHLLLKNLEHPHLLYAKMV